MRKLKVKIDALTVSERSMRRYIQALKDEISFKQPRYYEPVIDRVPVVCNARWMAVNYVA